MVNGLPCDQAFGFGKGLAATNPMALEGIKSGDNLLHIVSWVPSTGVYIGRDVSDFTVTDGAVEAATIDLSAAGTKFSAMWTNAPAA